ncbi:hypothetical protein ABZ897_22045 [Nonomuraea sp. NPDC046802]
MGWALVTLASITLGLIIYLVSIRRGASAPVALPSERPQPGGTAAVRG